LYVSSVSNGFFLCAFLSLVLCVFRVVQQLGVSCLCEVPVLTVPASSTHFGATLDFHTVQEPECVTEYGKIFTLQLPNLQAAAVQAFVSAYAAKMQKPLAPAALPTALVAAPVAAPPTAVAWTHSQAARLALEKKMLRNVFSELVWSDGL
jgi:hypothetical protein